MLNKRMCTCLIVMAAAAAGHQVSFAQQSTAPGLQSRLGNILSPSKEGELLEPEQAFKFNASVKGPTTVMADLTPANGYYLYRERIKFTLKNAPGVTIRAVKLPAGEIKTDQTYGRSETYSRPIQVEIVLDRAPKAKNLTLVAGYQGCHEKTGVCYPPIDKELTLALP